MKIKTSELTGATLDWAVAKADQPVYSDKALIRALTAGADGIGNEWKAFSPSTDWEQGGPIIEREQISVQHTGDAAKWRAQVWNDKKQDFWPVMYGPTPLIAAMRCFVASKLGDEVEVPMGL